MTKIAAIVTEYFHWSHADVMLGKFLAGFPVDEGLRPPRVEVASIYLDQVNEPDIGVATAARYGVPIYPSILKALTLGGDELAVDGVLIIGEHGRYPYNEKGQQLYPRRHLFEQVSAVLATSGRRIPVFSDKHLAYDWTDAKWMYDRATALGFPFMAGSSLPVCWRRPFLEYPLGIELQAAAVIAYGPIESYGFHALETLQCMVERRHGGESGVAMMRCLEGEAVWRWLDGHPTQAQLASAAAGALRETEGPWQEAPKLVKEPVAFVVTYRDGLEGVVLMMNGFCRSFAFAGLSGNKTDACEFVLQSGDPHGHFSYLSLNIEEMFLSGRPTYPVERTLLTTGVLSAAMDSRFEGHVALGTPHLTIAYQPAEQVPYRPRGPEPKAQMPTE